MSDAAQNQARRHPSPFFFHKKPAFMNKRRWRHMEHPFLVVNNKYDVQKKKELKEEIAKILYTPVHLSRHHLYPKDRTGRQGPYSSITLRIWCYKHFFGWNSLFQFFYKENGHTVHTELTIDEIITAMIERHPFIMERVGTPPWKVVFKEKGIEDAIDLLCRMLSMKFNRSHLHVVHEKIHVAIPKKYPATAIAA